MEFTRNSLISSRRSLVGVLGEDKAKKDAPLVDILSLEDAIRSYASTSQRLVMLITVTMYKV